MSATVMERVKTIIVDAITELDKIQHDVSLLMHHARTRAAA
jgi:hypothetical protein